MNQSARRIQKPRCFLLYALAPAGMPAAEANRVFNIFIGDRGMPLALFHDHFIGQPGGLAIFFVETPAERDALLNQTHLRGWQVEYQPLIFSHSPSALDEQIAFTLKAYRGIQWKDLREKQRPSYGRSARSTAREAETAEEE